MKLPNGFGSIKKLKGNRRRPYQVLAPGIRSFENGRAKMTQKTIGYCETYEEAFILLADYNKTPWDVDAKNITFKEIYEKFVLPKTEKLSKNTQLSYANAYNSLRPIHDKKIKDLRTAQLQEAINQTTPSTQSVCIILLHKVFKAAMENDFILKDYSKFVTKAEYDSKKKERYSKDEIIALWNAFADEELDNVDTILIQIYTGCRISEMLGIKKKDIHLDERYIEVHGTKNKQSDRIVPIHREIEPLIRKRMESDGEYLLFNPVITRVNYSQNIFQKVKTHLSMNHTTHDARRTFASVGHDCRVDDLTLKRMIGHIAGDITKDVYTQTNLENMIEAIDNMVFVPNVYLTHE